MILSWLAAISQVYYMNNVNSLKAIPPTRMAKAISKTVINNDFFQPKSLINAAMVAMQGMYSIATKVNTTI